MRVAAHGCGAVNWPLLAHLAPSVLLARRVPPRCSIWDVCVAGRRGLKAGPCWEDRRQPLCPGLAGRGAPDAHNAPDIPEQDLPHDEQGRLLRPGVVWFNESLDPEVLGAAEAATTSCDLFVTAGTSAVVYPAAGGGGVEASGAGRAAWLFCELLLIGSLQTAFGGNCAMPTNGGTFAQLRSPTFSAATCAHQALRTWRQQEERQWRSSTWKQPMPQGCARQVAQQQPSRPAVLCCISGQGTPLQQRRAAPCPVPPRSLLSRARRASCYPKRLV